ncbi:MAG: T9SS type A sorting domain-containing protein [Bacteroidia bacterium]|nr:T9SS type A sorting domain-containing protein [Bacteroidia bacterium]
MNLRLLFFLLLAPCALRAQGLLPRGITPNATVFSYATLGDTVFAVGDMTRVGFQTGGAAWLADSLPASQFPITDGDVYAIQPDGLGGWYIGGLFTLVDTFARSNLAHILPSGAVDPQFSTGTNGEVRALAFSGTQLYVGGKFTQLAGQSRSYLGRLNVPGGSLDPWSPQPNGFIFSLTLTADRLYAGGSFTRIQGVNQPAFAAFSHPGGQLLQTLGPVSGQVTAQARSGDRIYAGGTFLGNTGYYTGKGTLLNVQTETPSFAFPRFGGTVYALIPDGTGGWYAGGAFTEVNDQPSGRLVHLLPDLSIDPAFAPVPNGTVYALHLSGDTVFAGGTFTAIAGQARSNLAALKISNNSLLPWQPDPDGKVGVITSYGNRLVIGGLFTRVSGRQAPRLAVLDRSSGLPFAMPAPASGEVLALLHTAANGGHLYAGGTFAGTAGYPARRAALLSAASEISPASLPDFNGDLYAAVPDGAGGWYVAGAFTQANGQPIQRLAHLLADTTLDAGFSFDLNNAVYALARSGNTLYLGGLFTTVDGSTRNRAAAIDLSSSTLLNWHPDLNGQVEALLVSGGQVYLGGAFTTAGGQARNRLAAADAATGAISPWNPDAGGTVNALAAEGGILYAGGNFTTLGGQPRNRLAAVDASGAVTAWNPNVNGEVNALLAVSSTLYLGGSFTQVGGQTRNRLAQVDLSSGLPAAFHPNLDGTVEDLALMGGMLYAGGSFSQAGGQAYARLVSISPATGLPAGWQPVPNAAVYCLASSGGSLLAGGSFDALKSSTRNRLLDLLAGSLALQSWAPNLNNSVHTLAFYQNDLIAGGQFTQADGQARTRLARWNAASQSLTTWSPSADDLVSALAVRSDTLVAGGEFLTLGGASRARIGMLSLATGAARNWNPQADNPVLTLAQAGSRIAAGGNFDAFSAQTRNRLFCLDTGADTLTAWAPDLPGFLFGPRINALAVSGDSVWVGGWFSALSGEPRRNLALTDGQTGAILPPSADTEGEVFALHVKGADLWVGGQLLDSVNHVAREHVAVLDRHTGAVRPFNPSADNYVFTITSSPSLIALGGRMDQMLSFPRDGGFAIESSSGRLLPWNPGTGINSLIVSIALDRKQGHAYLGGSFSTLHGEPRQNLARVSLSSGAPDAWQADASQLVQWLEWDARHARLYVAGSFFSLGGQPRTYLGAVDASGQVLPFNPAPDGDIRDLALHDTTLYVAGLFTAIGGEARNRLAAFGPDGQVLPWAPEVQTMSGGAGLINALEAGAERLYAGGWFAQVNGAFRYRLAAFDLRSGELLPWAPPVDPLSTTSLQRVDHIRELGNNLFLTGSIQEVNGTSVNGFAWLDPYSGLVRGMRIIAQGSVFDLAAADSLLYLGGNMTAINQQQQFYHAKFGFPDNYFAEGYTDIVPRRGGNTGDVTAAIFGNGFRAGSRVLLRAAGMPDIAAYDSLLFVTSGLQLRATFNLRSQPPGMRDVLVISEGDTLVIPNGFEVTEGGLAEVWADAVLPAGMRVPRPGRKTQYTVMIPFGNRGNIDAEGVPIWVAVDTTLDVAGFDFDWIPQVEGAGNPADSNLTYIVADTVLGDAFGARVYIIVIPRIPAGFEGSLAMFVNPRRTGTARVMAWATDPLYGSPLKYAIGECKDLLLGQIAGLTFTGGCMYSALDAVLSPILDPIYDPQNFGTLQYAGNYCLTLANALVDCGIVLSGGGLAADLLKIILEAANSYNDVNTLLTQCFNFFPNPKPTPGGSTILGAVDPNQKSGRPGAGSQRWIAGGELMPYLVEFENVDTATAPAQTVIILDTLDASVYDLSSLRLTSFTIADSVFPIPYGRQQWTAWVDLRPRIASLVRMDASLDGNILRWEFESLSPATLAPQTGLLEGFLPPNLSDPEGRGSVSYTIDRLDQLPTFTTFSNRAAIYFDANAPILTNTWTNTLDVDLPLSQMAPLDSVQPTTAIPLSWQGSDIGSGVWYYRVMVSENDGPYRRAFEYVTDTAVVFPGNWGYRYKFYTLAVDSAGNVETAPAQPDASTRVTGSLSIPEPQLPVLALYPNPNDGSFTLEIQSPAPQRAQLRILDLTGRTLSLEEVRLAAGSNALRRSPGLPAGTYFLLLEGASAPARIRFSIR